MLCCRLLLSILPALATIALASQLFGQTEMIGRRQQLMKSNGEATKAIKAAAEAKDYATIESKAKEIIGNGDKVLDFFRNGNAPGRTKAKAEIWEKWDEFSRYPANVKKSAGELAEAAKDRDDERIAVKVKALGDACGACHKAFRADKYAE